MFLRQFQALAMRAADEGGGEGAPAAGTPPGSTSEAPPSGSDEPGGEGAGAPAGGQSDSGTSSESGGDASTIQGGAGDDAMNVVPETADGYEFKVSESAQKLLGDLTNDPAMKALREAGKEKGWTQAQFNDRINETINILADKGLLQPSFDPAAETTKLSADGKDGKARQQEVQVFADSLKARGELSEEEHAELTSLIPTAAGTGLVEKLRKMMGANGAVSPAAGGGDTKDALKEEARTMRRDPKYDTDPTFKGMADKKYREAWGI